MDLGKAGSNAKVYHDGNSITTELNADNTKCTITMVIDDKPRFYIEYNAEQLDGLITMLQNDRKKLTPPPQLN